MTPHFTAQQLHAHFLTSCESGDMEGVTSAMNQWGLLKIKSPGFNWATIRHTLKQGFKSLFHSTRLLQDILNEGLVHACFEGRQEVVRYLLTDANISRHASIRAQNGCCFVLACDSGHLEIVKYLLTSPELTEHASLGQGGGYALKCACKNGHVEVAMYLLGMIPVPSVKDCHRVFECAYVHNCEQSMTHLLYDMKLDMANFSFSKFRHHDRIQDVHQRVGKRDLFFQFSETLEEKPTHQNERAKPKI